MSKKEIPGVILIQERAFPERCPVGSDSSEGLGDERAAFEAWGQAEGLEAKNDDRGMNYPLGDMLWRAWQARAALQPAAQTELLTAISDVAAAFVGVNMKCHPPQEFDMDLLAGAIGRLRNAATALAAASAKPLNAKLSGVPR